MSQVSPPPGPSHATPDRVRAPLVGILTGLALLVGLSVWTAQRISAAESAQEEVAVKRAKDAERVKSQLDAPDRVQAATPAPARWQPRVEFDGTLKAEQAASLSFKVPGKLTRVAVKVGDVVKAGALLATLDSAESAAQLTASAAAIRAAEAQLALAEDTERRTRELVETGALAAAGRVQTEQQKALALAQLDSARAQQALARVSLASHSLVAPFAGTVTAAPDGVGTVVSPGSALFKLVNLEKLKLETTVSESDANLLQVGAPVTITTERGSVVGRISALLGALDERTRRVPVHAAFENPGQLRVGSFVRATVEAGEAIGVLRLPHDVLKPGSDTEVFVITGDGETSLLQSRLITYALDKDGSLLVRSGLAAQDRVLLSPKPESATGDKVVVVPAAAKDAQTEGDARGSSAAAAAPEKH